MSITEGRIYAPWCMETRFTTLCQIGARRRKKGNKSSSNHDLKGPQFATTVRAVSPNKSTWMAAIDMLEMVMLTMFNASPVYTSLSDVYAKNPRLFQIKRQGRWILDIYLYTSIPLSTFLTTMARLHANKLLLDDPSSKKRSRKAPKKDLPPVCFLWCPEGDDRRNDVIHASLSD